VGVAVALSCVALWAVAEGGRRAVRLWGGRGLGRSIQGVFHRVSHRVVNRLSTGSAGSNRRSPGMSVHFQVEQMFPPARALVTLTPALVTLTPVPVTLTPVPKLLRRKCLLAVGAGRMLCGCPVGGHVYLLGGMMAKSREQRWAEGYYGALVGLTVRKVEIVCD